MSRPKTFTPGESCCRFLCSLVTWQRLSTTAMGYPLPSQREWDQKPIYQKTSTGECKWLGAILALQPGFLWHCRERQCSATLRESMKTQLELFVRCLGRLFLPSLASAGHMCSISEEAIARSVALQVSPSVQQTVIPALQPSHETAQRECFL